MNMYFAYMQPLSFKRNVEAVHIAKLRNWCLYTESKPVVCGPWEAWVRVQVHFLVYLPNWPREFITLLYLNTCVKIGLKFLFQCWCRCSRQTLCLEDKMFYRQISRRHLKWKIIIYNLISFSEPFNQSFIWYCLAPLEHSLIYMWHCTYMYTIFNWEFFASWTTYYSVATCL